MFARDLAFASMTGTSDRWRAGRIKSAIYDAGVQRERIARPLARLMWGHDAGSLYADIARLATVPDGTAILDVPCGGGVAFRGLRPGSDLRYVAADLSPHMLQRAREEAEQRGIEGVELVEADAAALPFDDGSFDLCISYNGLHCFTDPERAVSEMGRVVRAGGEVRGTVVVPGAGRRQDALLRAYSRSGVFGAPIRVERLRAWMGAAGLEAVEIELDGAVARFLGRPTG